MPFPRELEDKLPLIDTWVRGGMTPDDAAKAARNFQLTSDQCQALKEEYLRRNRQFIDYTDPRVLRDNHRIESWYAGPDFDGAWCWPPFKQMLEAPERGWDRDDLGALDRASTKILASIPHPGTQAFNCRGLVVGYVQSGKTANYSALISKAADVGYRLFIVLSGITSSLRQQTQGRLHSDVVCHAEKNWNWLTCPLQDFGGNPGHPDSVIDVQSHKRRVIAVVKKNVSILDRLINWLGRMSSATKAFCPALVIDDEADNASVNTNDSALNPTAINEHIRKILYGLPKVAYVGYTATPFANIFIDPSVSEDLFPRNFIFDLDRPKAYFGAERIFGRELLWFDTDDSAPEGLDIVRNISVGNPDEPGMLRPALARERFGFEPRAPETLKRAIRYFLLATAARYARGQTQEHSSMLVHTTMYVDLHTKMQELLVGHLQSIISGYENEKEELEALWNDEMTRVPPPPDGPTPIDALWEHLPAVLKNAEVVVDNGRVESTLRYTRENPRVVVAVGGNTFSRGLTLEGLVVSYYIRRAGAYDTLLQMGRWFGYRPGYEDLPRIWMTNDLQEQFLFLAGIEEEIRQDIRRLENEQRRPLDLAIRVRTHPKLMITARNKMGAARIASASFSDRTLQSFLFKHEDGDWLRTNITAATELGRGLSPAVESVGSGRRLARAVDVSVVLTFLDAYSFHPSHEELRTDLLKKYIRAENGVGALLTWNVAWIGQDETQPALGVMSLGLGTPLNCISRTRFRQTVPCNIKALISRTDRLIDLPQIPRNATDAEIVAARNAHAAGIGLLLLYPVSRNSTPEVGPRLALRLCGSCGKEHQVPTDGAAVRHPLGAVEDVVGVALVFPKSTRPEDTYMATDIGALFLAGEPEEGEIKDEDATELEK